MTYVGIGLGVFLILMLLIVIIMKKKKVNFYKDMLDNLEVEKNLVGSIPLSLELSKVESLVKNDELSSKYNDWQDRINKLKNELLPKIDDSLIELDAFFEKKDFDSVLRNSSKVELEIYKVKEYANTLLSEIKELTSSDEKYRGKLIKLKAKYRKVNADFQNHKNLYEGMQDAVSLQLENIEKRFLDFEKCMEKNEYNEVMHIIKALDGMINHIAVVVKEVPDLVVMCKQLIPNKIKEVRETYEMMSEKGYILEYLNIDYNLDESLKNTENIMDRVKVLNLEDCMLELKTILKYLDSLFVDFEKERLSRKVYEEMEVDFNKKLKKTNKIVKDVTDQLEQIKNTYDLRMEDLEQIGEENKALIVINDDYKKLKLKLKNKSTPYSELHKEIESLTYRLKEMTEDLDVSLKSLGNMYDDEQRAREQLDEIEKFLKESKRRIRQFKLPVINDKYFVELNEANEAIGEVIKELSRKPIVIKTLNTRVDTARDLVLKLYNTTNEIIKKAYFAENVMVYANRFRGNSSATLDKAETMFFKGDYTASLKNALAFIKKQDEDCYNDIIKIYKEV